MPEGTTGIELIDPKVDFRKYNVRWVNGNTRDWSRYKKVKRERVKSQYTKQVTVRLTPQHYDYLYSLALDKCRKRRKPYTINELIRDCLKQHMSDPQTIDMLGNKKP